MTTRILLVGGAIAALISAPTAFATGQSAMQQDEATGEMDAARVGETEAEAEARRARMMEGTDTSGTTEAGAMTGSEVVKDPMAKDRAGAWDAEADAADEAADVKEEEEEERQTPA